MAKKKKEPKRITKKLLNKYRLVILNEDTFEERISFKLTRLNVFVLLMITSIVLVSCTTILIAFTPLREYIPGYSSTSLNQKATRLVSTADSLETVLAVNQEYYNSIKKVLNGDVKTVEFDIDSAVQSQKLNPDEVDLNPSEQDIKLREEVSREDKYSLFESEKSSTDFSLFPPVKGSITSKYNVNEKHYAIDIAVPKDTPIKAAAAGTVIFAEWTSETGHVIILEHGNSLLTVYKHNASLTKQQGELVKSGEVIATAGSTGELSTGPHLHFELWRDGYPTDPSKFIDFE
ncbi:M23 family peptidase [Aquimarina sp. AD1]|uniref:M23 family metallopeptidase n=1 Tax=Aquimarina TaxID=290174 RepID=UPI0003FEBB75|nr:MULTISPECIES: M23 family metallopeptidase [Aquimarina]AXT57319.1 M23 family peptidase [Aquimarina sp. AD1]RKN13101.1 M23 family metallopeptidase [Aquimarina sp. AD1]